jgi:hypothetical protein
VSLLPIRCIAPVEAALLSFMLRSAAMVARAVLARAVLKALCGYGGDI